VKSRYPTLKGWAIFESSLRDDKKHATVAWQLFHKQLISAVFALWLAATAFAQSVPTSTAPVAQAEPGEELSGGETTVFDTSPKAFGFPAANLHEEHRPAFFVGHSFFNENWVVAPASTAGRDGLGPLFNARSCSACHLKDGRGRPPEPGEPMVAMLIRLSIPGRGVHGEPVPEPTYGDQIQGQSIPGVRKEADALVEYQEVPGQFADGEAFSLRRPTYVLKNPGYGPLAKQVMLSPRVAPTIIGLGLLELVPEQSLRAIAAEQANKSNGIAGRLNRVWDKTAGEMAPGRYGWKGEQPSVLQQTAGAFVGDMGITSSLFPEENCTAAEEVCAQQPSGGHPEVSDKILKDVVTYARTLAVPARRDWTNAMVLRGKALFARADCAECHVPKLQTGDCADLPELSNQTVRPYSDLLLHDMGEALADNRPVFEAGPRDWRTPPLWGIGLVFKINGHTCFLHDGRARNLAEAILWHGGEAKNASEKFRAMPKAEREALIAFLQSL
jgi:CxxC motif-containing protein (DUF1111 family)